MKKTHLLRSLFLITTIAWLTGCGTIPQTATRESPAPVPDGPRWTIFDAATGNSLDWNVAVEQIFAADVIVVGTGGSGLVAAITAADAGAKVLQFEKTDTMGGCWLVSGGSSSAALTKIQIENGVEDSEGLFYTDCMKMGHYLSDPDILKFHVTHAGLAVDWLDSLGVETEFLIYGENVTGIAFGDGVEEEARAFGFFGGKEGSVNRAELRYPDGTVRVAKAKEIIRDIPVGTVFNERAGGGGGYGDPFMRPVEKVLDDVRNDMVSLRSAREDYGVVIEEGTFTVNEEETKRLRGVKK